MSGINPIALFHVNQIEITFADEIGNTKTILGTGFWLKANDGTHFVTNAHNINPKMKLGESTAYQIHRGRIRLRLMVGNQWHQPTELIELTNVKDFVLHKSADVALLRNPAFAQSSLFTQTPFLVSDLADQNFFQNDLSAMDVASFVGFPGSRGVLWYDELWKVAIARAASIASIPNVGFTNSAVRTADTVLVSGLSFSGSSGSPVISHEKGFKIGPGSGLTGPYTPPKLIGVMSGHWRNDPQDKSALEHSGLSYFTRSTSIIELLQGVNIG